MQKENYLTLKTLSTSKKLTMLNEQSTSTIGITKSITMVESDSALKTRPKRKRVKFLDWHFKKKLAEVIDIECFKSNNAGNTFVHNRNDDNVGSCYCIII
jgi:hypothetical protein